MAPRRKNKLPPEVVIQAQTRAVSAPPGRRAAILRNANALRCLLILMVCVIVYANTLNAPLVFDDNAFIINNPTLRDWRLFARVQVADIQGIGENYMIPLRSRVAAFFTFAINYRLHGLAPFGYHVFNLMVHAGAALTIYWLLTMLLRTPRGRIPDDEFTPRWAPLLAALIFAAHPLQTYAVTYVSQRFTSLSTLFYLLTLALYVWARLNETHKRSTLVYVLSALMALMAVRTKETALTLPAALVLVELCFFNGWREIRYWRLIPWALIAMIIPLSLLYQRGSADIAGAANAANIGSISMWDYFLTEQRVLLTYLRLLVAPVNQNIDYDYPIYNSLFKGEVLGSMLTHAGLLWLAAHSYRSSRREGMGYLRWGTFGIAWFYLALSVESSFIPLGDMIEEYRMYLPMAGLCMSVAVLWAHLGRSRARLFYAVAVCVLIALGVSAIVRNRVWSDPISLWQDTVNKSPNKARPYNNLGQAYSMAGKKDEALKAFLMTLEIDPSYLLANMNAANILVDKKQYKDALKYYEAALYLNPNDDSTLSQMGYYYMLNGEPQKAESFFQRAIEANPYDATTLNNAGELYRSQGRCDKAMVLLQEAIRLEPQMVEARSNIGTCLLDQGQYDAAIRELSAALSLNPKLVEVQVNLGMAYLRTGQSLFASERFRAALELEQSAEIMTDLADAYQSMGESAKSEEYYLMAIKTDPEFGQARFNYTLLLFGLGRRADAVAQVEALRKFSPERYERLMSEPSMRAFLTGK